MNGGQVDHEFISRQFFAVLRAIANGETNLLAVVQIPNEYGRTVRVDMALNEWFQPAMELFVTRRRPWVTPVPGIPQFDGNPPI